MGQTVSRRTGPDAVSGSAGQAEAAGDEVEVGAMRTRLSTQVTETVNRKQFRPVLLAGAKAMDEIFDAQGR